MHTHIPAVAQVELLLVASQALHGFLWRDALHHGTIHQEVVSEHHYIRNEHLATQPTICMQRTQQGEEGNVRARAGKRESVDGSHTYMQRVETDLDVNQQFLLEATLQLGDFVRDGFSHFDELSP